MKLDFSNKYDEAFAYKLCSKFIINCLENTIDFTEIIRHDDQSILIAETTDLVSHIAFMTNTFI